MANRGIKFSWELAHEICDRVRQGEPKIDRHNDPAMPRSHRTISQWREKYPPFDKAYKAARRDWLMNYKVCCEVCNKLTPIKNPTQRYCSVKCHAEGYKAEKLNERLQTRKKCNDCGKEMVRKQRETHAYFAKKQFCSVDCTRDYRKELMSGERNFNWKGGVNDELVRIRHSYHYRIWRKKVLARDGNTCQKCNDQEGPFHVDHILPFSLYPEKRLELSNGRTLCIPCHIQTNTYGKKVFAYKPTEIMEAVR